MSWSKSNKLAIMIVVLIIGLSLTWGIVNRENIAKKVGAVKAKISATMSKIPLIGKLFTAKPEEEVKDGEEAKEEKQSKPIEIKAFKVAQIHFTDVLPIIGSIRGFKRVNLRFEVNGLISSFNFREGDLVEEGDIITELDHGDSQLKVKFREAKLGAAKARMLASKNKLGQHQQLYDAGAILQSKLQEIEFEYQNASEEYKAANVELESAKLELEKTYLRSPIDGVLESKDVEVGEYVSSTVQIASMGEISEVYLEMGIIEKDLERIQLGQSVKLRVDTYPDDEFDGEIDNIFPLIEGRSRTLTVWARISNPQNELLPGMFARGSITVYEKEDAIIAPPLSFVETEEGYQVFVIDSDDIIHPQAVDVEYRGNPEYWVVADGLSADEIIVNEVVSADINQLKDGDTVEILETEEYTF